MTDTAPQIGYALRAGDPSPKALEAQLDTAETKPVDLVELPVFELALMVDGRIQQGALDELKSVCGGRALSYSVHGPIAINLMDHPGRSALHLDILKASIEITAELGARHLVVHTGISSNGSRAEIDAAYERQRVALEEVAGIAAGSGVVVCVETLPMERADRHTALPSRLAYELKLIDHPNIRCCLDVSHAYINCGFHGRDLLEELAPLAPFAEHLHLHDSFGRPNDIRTVSRAERIAYGLGDLHLPLGWGSIPWNAIFSELDFPKSPVMMLELPPPHADELDNCIATMQEWRAKLAGR
ncbi:sugar phosphate isomerase/epimerase family protein [Dichotomicrobium thermohalophilum]|uniref:Sugar phosphate isomerase/epimerase n=1 Tax=Dichotomicrobium thermohalophilum TaxID=933063 RepID=A0A397Q1S8_9HYPH|nr:sugar phosphate isomerase/epimerase [Dichotomicrobium thermohalophilum]RIA55122.1 sugar phosphate isomerase/epimerase [Dichotomicrobium thermohalophilum]